MPHAASQESHEAVSKHNTQNEGKYAVCKSYPGCETSLFALLLLELLIVVATKGKGMRCNVVKQVIVLQ
jgi:hypothetical protein